MKISVITATRNCQDTVSECLESVAGQSYQAWEHIVIDGASKDDTLQVLETYRSQLSVLLSEPDDGVYDALNKGIVLADGDVIGFLHADDLYAGTEVLAHVAAVFSNQEVEAVYGDLVYVFRGNTQRILRYWHSDKYRWTRFLWGWMPPHPTFFVRKRVYEKYGSFNLEMGSAADYELMLRFLVRHRIRAAYIPEVLVCMRTGGISNASLKNRLIANRMDRKAWRVNGLKPYPCTIALKPIRKIPQYFRKGKFFR